MRSNKKTLIKALSCLFCMKYIVTYGWCNLCLSTITVLWEVVYTLKMKLVGERHYMWLSSSAEMYYMLFLACTVVTFTVTGFYQIFTILLIIMLLMALFSFWKRFYNAKSDENPGKEGWCWLYQCQERRSGLHPSEKGLLEWRSCAFHHKSTVGYYYYHNL
jgi:Ca2+/Na+ antiporter